VLRRLAIVFALFAAVSAVTAVQSAKAEDVLLVGNSFTAGIKTKLRYLLRSAGRDTSVYVRASEGWTLAMHAESSTTTQKIQWKPWDAVVLQEQSDGMLPERFPSARLLESRIDERTVFFMTWRDRSALLEDYDNLRGVPGGDTGYVAVAAEVGAVVAPVGWAFREILVEEPDAELWRSDGHHASERGRYVAALVLYATITGDSTVGLWMSPRLTEEQALHDQMLVDALVLERASEWNFE
jgi:hypothetical protein